MQARKHKSSPFHRAKPVGVVQKGGWEVEGHPTLAGPEALSAQGWASHLSRVEDKARKHQHCPTWQREGSPASSVSWSGEGTSQDPEGCWLHTPLEI